jgi:hypothetical protein
MFQGFAVLVNDKPSSVMGERCRATTSNHFSRCIVAAAFKRPTRKLERVALHSVPARGSEGRENVCLHGLAPDGVYLATLVTERAVGSYPTFSPSPQSDVP